MKTAFRKALTTTAAALLVCMGGNAQAGILTLAETPLFLTASVDPNVFFLLDDSGSMDWEILVDEASNGRGYESPSSTNAKYAYLYYKSGDPYLYSNSGNTSRVEDEVEDGGKSYWRFKSSDYNAMYYNPAVTYLPWAGTNASGVVLYANASPTAAPWDPENTSEGTMNLTSTSNSSPNDGYYPAKYYRWNDADSDDWPDASGEHTLVEIKPATAIYTGEGREARTDCVNADATPPSCSYAEEIQNFANWFTYYRKRSYVAWAAIGRVITDSTSVRTGIFRLNDGLYSTGSQSVFDLENSTDKFNILDSLYCETDTYCAKASGTPTRPAMEDLGDYFAGSNSPILPANAGGKCQQNFNITVTDGYWNTGSTSVGNEDGNDDTAFDGGHYADSQSNTLADVAMRFYEDDLKPDDVTYPDEVPTIAGIDEATHQHLVTYGVAFGVVGTLDPFGTKTPSDPSDTDPTDSGFNWPTVVSDQATTIDDLWHAAYNGRGQFLSAGNPEQLITSLGAALSSIADRTASSSSVALSSGFLNSGSLLFQARFDSSDWSGQLLAYSIVASGNGVGNLGTMPEWDAGCVLTGGLCPTNTIRTSYTGQSWSTGRDIITIKPSSGVGIPFRWPSNPSAPGTTDLDAAQITALKTEPLSFISSPLSPTIETDAIGQSRLEFLRGRTVNTMRSRTSILGDIINSNPVYVAAPAFAYPDSLEAQPYSGFASTYANRKPMIYVGANDGMLHAFDASKTSTGGTEMLAYVPSKVYSNLSALTSIQYGSNIGHRTFVDASPTAGDVFWGSSWKTVLVGALGKGGQGLFALNVTNPTTTNFIESNASSLVLWEFTDANDADLGFTYGQPAIVRMHNGKWAAVIGNGYNNTDNQNSTDTNVSSTGNGVIYVIDIQTGALIKKFDTGEGVADDPTGAARPNGVATPSPVDLDGDRIVDYIYAPDLFGNVWKLDVSDSNASNWDFAYKSGSSPQPFFIAKNGAGTSLPITTRVEVGLHPNLAGQMVYFGTGKYIETGDNSASGQDTQVFYGVWDRNEASGSLSVITRGHLEPQAIVEELPFSGNSSDPDNVRRTSSNNFSWHITSGLPSTNLSATSSTSDPGRLGWRMDLYSTENGNTNNYGERMVADPVLRDGKIIFVTLLPLDDPCDFGGDSWLMEVSAATGSRLDITPFDLNGDGNFDTSDFVPDGSGGTEAVGGVKSGVGIMPTPGILKDNTYGTAGSSGGSGGAGGKGREFKYFSGSSGAIQKVTESRGGEFVGRQSWREIYDN